MQVLPLRRAIVWTRSGATGAVERWNKIFDNLEVQLAADLPREALHRRLRERRMT
jgi:hypothetical protein